MAKIAEFVAKIRTAIYGKDVRESIAAGIEAINAEAEDAKASAERSAQEAAAAKLVADNSAANADLKAQLAEEKAAYAKEQGDRAKALTGDIAELRVKTDQALEAAGVAQELGEDALRALFGGTLPSKVLAENSPAVIQKAAQLKLGASFWSVGDMVPITLNGTVGLLTFQSETYCPFILGFDHNEELEGPGIHFQFGKTADGIDIAFVDSDYESAGDSAAFRMNTTNTNSGGWEGSYMRNTICPAFLAAMPQEWQDVIAPCTKYSDNVGKGMDSPRSVTATSDKLWLLATYEAFGYQNGENRTEYKYQKQYDYYRNGNSKVRYKQTNTTERCGWSFRSPYYTSSTTFSMVLTGGGASHTHANKSTAFAPGFKVA